MLDIILKYITATYALCHILAWLYNAGQSEAKKLELAQRKHALRRHVLDNHPDHPSQCEEVSCSNF